MQIQKQEAWEGILCNREAKGARRTPWPPELASLVRAVAPDVVDSRAVLLDGGRGSPAVEGEEGVDALGAVLPHRHVRRARGTSGDEQGGGGKAVRGAR